MKKGILFIAALLLNIAAFAQSFEGKIVYSISFPNMTEEMKQMEAMMPKEMTSYFSEKRYRSEMPSMMGTNVTINNGDKKEVYTLMDMMGQKNCIKNSYADFEKEGKPMPKITETSDTKTIAGYTCKKAILSMDSKKGKAEIEVYYAPELTQGEGSWGDPAMRGLKGMPLEYSIQNQGMSMKFSAKSVSKEKVDAVKFEVPSDYKITTMEEYRKSIGGMGGN